MTNYGDTLPQQIYIYSLPKYRSVFDNIASIPNSFNELIKKARSSSLPLDFKYVQLILKCDWFENIKMIRDSIEHQGAETNADYNKDKVLFMVSSLDSGLQPFSCTKLDKVSAYSEKASSLPDRKIHGQENRSLTSR
ncbi:MAG: hypothetical protein M3P08_19515 [Thermoproteota archaeon]|nr:hypothetical protein [Thermoproteota archaeon]